MQKSPQQLAAEHRILTNKLKEKLALIEKIKKENDDLQNSNVSLQNSLAKANEKINWFTEQFKLAQHLKYVRSSEKTAYFNLTLFDEQECDEVAVEQEPIDDETINETRKRPKKKSQGRKLDTSKLNRERVIHDLPEDKKVCPCGCELKMIGEDVSEEIDLIPAQLKVIEHVKLKYACSACENITAGEKPERAMPKCMASNRFIADVICKKYETHLPLYRQAQTLSGEGCDIPDNTLGNWVNGAAEALKPLDLALREQFAFVNLLQADETTLKILKPDKKGYMWAYHSLEENNRFILYEFDVTRASKVAEATLAEFSGKLQTDGYSGYNYFRQKESVINFGCWDHARRKFSDAIKANNNNKSGLAGKIVKLINKLYKIERQIGKLTADEKSQKRQELAKPIIEEMEKLIEKSQVLPKSALGKAVTYLMNNKPYLKAYLDHGDMPISNCLVENLIRPLALGRKNYLFAGNPETANKAALLYSLIQTCRMNHINPKAYLAHVLNEIGKVRRNEITAKSLLPQFIDRSIFTDA